MTDITLELAGEQVVLLPEYAMLWQDTLFIADTHWGKDSTFRAHGVPVPGGALEHDLKRLASIIDRTGAQQLIVLGDLFHAKKGRDPYMLVTVGQWREQYRELQVLIVRGNHDVRAGDPPEAWDFTCVDAPYALPPFTLQHLPDQSPDGYALAGHLHPGARLWGRGRQSITLPCFWFGRRVGVLPAFGSFTGQAQIAPQQGDHVFVLVDDEIIAVT